MLAAVLQRPVVLCFGVFEGANRYRLEFISMDIAHLQGRTAERAEAATAMFATHLQRQVRQAPLNWFNFYDFFDLSQ